MSLIDPRLCDSVEEQDEQQDIKQTLIGLLEQPSTKVQVNWGNPITITLTEHTENDMRRMPT